MIILTQHYNTQLTQHDNTHLTIVGRWYRGLRCGLRTANREVGSSRLSVSTDDPLG